MVLMLTTHMSIDFGLITTERECLAMVFSVKKFRHYLVCNLVVFFVDHMAIKYVVNKPELNGRLARWVLLLKEFDYTVQYKPGRMHLQADHLSRLSEDMGTSPIDDRFTPDCVVILNEKTQKNVSSVGREVSN